MIPPISNRARESATESALRLQNARLAALQQVMLGLTSTLNLDEVLARVVEMAQSLSASAHAHVFLFDSRHEQLTIAASHWSEGERRVALRPRASGTTASVVRTGRPEFVSDTSGRAAYADVSPEARPGAIACLPLIKDARILGTLNLGYWEPHDFDADTRSFLELLAQHAALAIDNARLHSLAIEQARMEHELEMARDVQTSLIPRKTPTLAGWQFATRWQPAHVVGGDLYDFTTVAADSQQPLQVITIADVSDKGMPAALFMALTRATLRASISVGCCASECVAHTNRALCEDASGGMFVTMFHAQLNPTTGDLLYVNAGHNRPMWYRHELDDVVEFERTGMALGIDPEVEFGERDVQLQPGDFVLFYTDGITEATNDRMEAFGEGRLRQLLTERSQSRAEEIIAALDGELRAFVGRAPQYDDITAVVLKRD